MIAAMLRGKRHQVGAGRDRYETVGSFGAGRIASVWARRWAKWGDVGTGLASSSRHLLDGLAASWPGVAFAAVAPRSNAVLRETSWWAAHPMLAAAGGMAAGIVLSCLAVLLVRRRSRVEMEGTLRTNTLLATLIDHLPDMVFVKNKKGLYVVTNRTHSRFHGANSEEDFLGKTSQEVLPMDLARRITVADDKVLAEGHVLIEEEEQSRDTWGNTRWLSTTRVPLRDGGGRVIGMVGISRDITERKAAEQRLIHLNRVHAMVTDINQAMVRIRDRQTLLQEACRITVEDGQMRMACVVLPERERMVKIGAYAGVEGGFFDAVPPSRSHALRVVLRAGARPA